MNHQNMHHESQNHLNHHQMMAEDFKRRFFVTLPITIIVLLLSTQIQEWFRFSIDFIAREYVLFILGTIIVVYGGKPFFITAKEELKTRNFGMMTLVSLALLAGYIFSVATTFLFEGESLWWEISTLTLAFLFGHFMEMRAVIGTGGALKELSKLIPVNAHRIEGKNILEVPTEKLKTGDLILVKPGEKIPADGMVIEGSSSANESLITGESKPVEKEKDDRVIGGSINFDGSLTIKVTKTGKESALSEIMNLIIEAQSTKPSVQKLADRAANYLTIIAITVGVFTFAYWMFVNPMGITAAATFAITVIVITCPHALGLAIPTVTTITTTLAARSGILIRDMKGLEVARKLDYLVLDKTGTLTKGEFGVTKIIPFENTNERDLLSLAAAVELNSEHSIAKGIVDKATKEKIKFSKASAFKSISGKGAMGIVSGNKIIVGNLEILKDQGVEINSLNNKTTGTVVYVAKGKKLLGSIFLEDEIREESNDAIEAIHRMGIKVAMLTGDKKEVGESVGKKIGIDMVFSEVLPKDKVDKVKELQKKGNIVAMVGDGINDAPSLTQANLGIAIGAGTDVAIESAEIVLVKSNPLDIVKAINLSRKTNTKMKQNLLWATGYNVIAIPAAAGMFATYGLILRPEWAALIMSASSVIVVANALLLKNVKL